MSREHLDVGDLIEKSTLAEQRRLCGVPKEDSGEVEEGKWGPDPLPEKERNTAQGSMDRIDIMVGRLLNDLHATRDNIGKVLSDLFKRTSVGGRPEFRDLKKASVKLDEVNASLKEAKHLYQQALSKMR